MLVKNEPRAFATTVLDVLRDDELYARLSDGAAKSVRMNGTVEMAEKVVAVYRQVIAGRVAAEATRQLSHR